MTYIIAVDPGDTCGYAQYGVMDYWDPDSVSAGQMASEDWEDWCSTALVGSAAHITLVVEKFMITARTAELSPQPRAIEVIGVMKFLARQTGATFVGTQTPSAAKKFASDAQLRKVGLWKPGQDHARDAIRHLLLAIATHGDGQARQEMLQSLA